jgi:hypothetical protein
MTPSNPCQPMPRQHSQTPSTPSIREGVGVGVVTQTPSTGSTPTRSSYRCRDHHHIPVTWRGKGCTLCPPLHTKKSKRRKTPEIIDEWWTQ